MSVLDLGFGLEKAYCSLLWYGQRSEVSCAGSWASVEVLIFLATRGLGRFRGGMILDSKVCIGGGSER